MCILMLRRFFHCRLDLRLYMHSYIVIFCIRVNIMHFYNIKIGKEVEFNLIKMFMPF